MMMMLGHVALIVIEIAIFELYADVIWEFMYLWLAYYSFMTCTRPVVYFYSLILFVACGMGAMNILTIMAMKSILATLGFPL